MKRKLFLPLLMVATLTACTTPVEYSLDDYKSEITMTKTAEEGFRIICLNDLHMGIMTNLEEEFEYLDKLLAYGGPQDLIVLNGDAFHCATKEVVRRTLDYFDSKGIPFTYVYGNHDLEGKFDHDFINRELLARENCIIKNPVNDNVYGDSNYFVNVNKDGELYWQIHFFDTNTYQVGEYDMVHQDQVDWYKDVVNTTSQQEGRIIPSLTFMHIPFKEFNDAWAQYGSSQYTVENTNGDSWVMIDTGVASPNDDCNLFEAMDELDSTKGVVVAHDHTNNSDFRYHDIRLIYGTKTGHNLYHDERMMGASYYTLGLDQNGNVNPNEFRLERANLLYGQETPIDNTDLHLVLGGNQ